MDTFARRFVPALLAVLVIGAPQAGGAVYRWTAVAVALTTIVMVVVALGRASVRANARVDLICAALIGVAAWTAFQLVPLPTALVRLVAPRVAGLYAEAGALPGAVPRTFIPLTLDVSLTAVEAVKWACYAAIYALILNWPRGAGRQISYMFLVAAALTAAVCLVESVFGVSGILGIYQPVSMVSSWLHGPFVNPGHSGIYCAMLGTLCLGIAPEMPVRLRPWIRGLAIVLLVLALTPALLKTTIAALVGPLMFFLLRARAANWRFVRGRPLAIGVGVFLVGALVAARWLPSPEQIRAMPNRYMAFRRFSRLIVWDDTWGMLKNFRWTGVGRGAFGPAFTAYDTVNAAVITWHAENVPLQMTAEWGAIVTWAFIVAMVVLVLRAARNARRPRSSAAAAVLIMLAVVSLVDFNLELLGIGLTTMVCMGILTRAETPKVRIRTGLAVLVAPATLIVMALLASFTIGGRSPEHDADAIRAAGREPVDLGELDRVGAAAALRHPADFFIPQVVAVEQLRLQASLGLPWLNRALTLRPRSPETHYFVGLALHRAGRYRQALGEYVAASRFNHTLVHTVGDVILRNSHLRRAALGDPSWAMPDDLPLLDFLAAGVGASGTAEELFRLDERHVQIAPNAIEALPALLRQKPLAFRDRAMLLRLNAAAAVSEHETHGPYLMAVAELRAKVGLTAEAIKLFGRAAAASVPPAHPNLAATELVRLLLAQGQAREALQKVEDLQHREHLSNGDAELLRGMIQDSTGDLKGAVYSYVRAAQYYPDDVEALVAAALAAQRASRDDMAHQYARRALDAANHAADVRDRLAPVVGP